MVRGKRRSVTRGDIAALMRRETWSDVTAANGPTGMCVETAVHAVASDERGGPNVQLVAVTARGRQLPERCRLSKSSRPHVPRIMRTWPDGKRPADEDGPLAT